MKDRMRAAAPLLIVAAVLIAYFPILNNGFVNWDDDAMLLQNLAWRGLDWPHLKWMFTSFSVGAYQPLAWIVLAVVFKVQGLNPLGFHLASLVFHVANAVTLYFLLRRLLDKAAPASGPLLAALLWALNPVQVQLVAWATPLADVMATFFFLLSLHAYLEVRGAKSRAQWLALALVLFVASGLCRWKGFALPLVLVLLDFERKRAVDWIEKIPFLVVSAAILWINALAKAQSGGQFQAIFRPQEASAAVLFYLSKLLAPFNLIPLYALDGSLNPVGWSGPLCVAAVLAISVGLILVARPRPAWLSAWLFFLASLLPPLLFTAPGPVFASLAHPYLACMGFAALAAAGLTQSRAARVAALGLLPLMAIGCRFQAGHWHDSISLWSHALSVDPEAYAARNNLAAALLSANRTEEAIRLLREEVALRPNDDVARANLAYVLAQLKRTQDSPHDPKGD